MSRIFWDTNLFIYLFEDYSQLSKRVSGLRERMIVRGDQLLTSTLTLGEILVKPLEKGDEELAKAYREAVSSAAVLLPFDREAAGQYARIRKDRTIRAPDALQLSCAAQARVDLFITNDVRLAGKVIPGIQFLVALENAFL